MTSYKHVFISHAYGGDLHQMIEAIGWVGSLCRHFCLVPVVPWIPLCLAWDETDRAMSVEITSLAIARCSELWLVGSKLSGGMRDERETCKVYGVPVRDFVGMNRVQVYNALIESGWAIKNEKAADR